MSEFWDTRYSSREYIYGKTPNIFLEGELNKIKPGKILFLGEGEGRNAVYAASLGWEVDAVDYSAAGKDKAEKLAAEKKVKINYRVENLADFNPRQNYYDAVVLIYLHLDEVLRENVTLKSISALKREGKIILEAFEKDQLKYSSGGPANEELLYSLSEIAEDFIDLEFEKFSKEIIQLNEGSKHKGKAAVIRFVGVKN
ncbi:MAG: SAM-dependent methyltransferase [Ignavibacteriae bacterium HGW-Ignavibacteriae-3]|nr:MAG: SAM-dependent methyltransferase [Ignavibacteriae bacterium HGW-Ignavibacteriae-3]